ncbi:MAG: DNA translocase FtsK 4TM domain-containing protein [Planctomycetes bacterium]|nr:DNA translocase FtsK 4TM domain-containing protein [Planctomycetota bacterium]MBL7144024.1 DNA translocase FtsK 4TM domain-containing protein [Phycisphaerae bacterium]
MAKKKSYKRISKDETSHFGAKAALICIGIGTCLIILCSCLSFDIGDRPSKFVYPQNNPPANWCGTAGAFCAYYLLYYIGPGVFVILISCIWFLFARLRHKQLNQLVLRSIGLGLTTVAASMSFQCLWPYRFFNFPMGSGGVLGIGAAQLMRNHFASLGTFILVLAIWAVGTILLADNFILVVLHAFDFGFRKLTGVAVPAWSATKQSAIVGQGLTDIWQKLSARQKPLVVNSEVQKRLEVAPLKPMNIIPVIHSESQKAGSPKARTPKSSAVQPSYDGYEMPPLDLLAEPEYGFTAVQEKVVKAKAISLERLLSEFNINARVVAAETGPVVTMFELELAAGVKVSQISSLANDMARALGVGAVRVVAPLPGRHTIGIEVPNSEKEKVRMKSMMELAGSKPGKMQIPLFLGKDSSGEALVSDLTKMPHLLIAGTTGSGKSVCINSIVIGILLTKRPDEVKMILIDPKMVEMTAFNTIPHLMCPIVTETSTAVQILEWATVKMDERYALLAEARVKNIAEFNSLGAEEVIKRFNPSSKEEEAIIPKKLQYIVIVIDELADLMMTAAKEIEAYIVRLAQKSRAVGIHIILATQRPQATVVTGLIKSNMPTRVAFRVAARMDSRIILDQNGAETLLGEGDMLFLKPGTSDLIRAQGTFLDEPEIKRVVKYLKDIAEPQFHPELTQLKKLDPSEMVRDDLFDDAVRIVLETKRGSVSLLQRRLSVGYARASRIIEMMAGAGILGEYKGSQAREVMMTLEEYENIREQMEREEAMEEPEPESPSSAEPAYVSEGQRGYIATDSEND